MKPSKSIDPFALTNGLVDLQSANIKLLQQSATAGHNGARFLMSLLHHGGFHSGLTISERPASHFLYDACVAIEARGFQGRTPEDNLCLFRHASRQLLFNQSDPDPASRARFNSFAIEYLAKSQKFVENMAAKGNPYANLLLGEAYFQGTVYETNPTRALNLFRRAAKAGEAISTFMVAHTIRSGFMHQFDDLVLPYLWASADKGYITAQQALGNYLVHLARTDAAAGDSKSSSQKLDDATEMYERSASQGYVDGWVQLARLFEFRSKPEQALPCFMQAALMDRHDATTDAIRLYTSDNPSTKNLAEAFRLCDYLLTRAKEPDAKVMAFAQRNWDAITRHAWAEEQTPKDRLPGENGVWLLFPHGEPKEPYKGSATAILIDKKDFPDIDRRMDERRALTGAKPG